jgi:hypothetical protein
MSSAAKRSLPASWRESRGLDGGEDNADSEVIEEWIRATGAVVMGRKMFSGGEGPLGGRSAGKRLVKRRPPVPRAGVRAHPSRSRDEGHAGRYVPVRPARDRRDPARGLEGDLLAFRHPSQVPGAERKRPRSIDRSPDRGTHNVVRSCDRSLRLLAFSAHSERTPTRALLPTGAQTQAAPSQ